MNEIMKKGNANIHAPLKKSRNIMIITYISEGYQYPSVLFHPHFIFLYLSDK